MTEISDANSVETVRTSQRIGNTAVQKETVIASQHIDKNELQLARINQVIWLVIHLIGIIIGLRFLFLLFGANLTGFALLVYNLSVPFVRLFQGIFPAPATNGSYFDTAAILALLIWYLLGFIITYVISMFSKRVVVE